jgi:hypothetical protein
MAPEMVARAPVISFPNPFRPGDLISAGESVGNEPLDLRIFDCLGRLVFSTQLGPGGHGMVWEAFDRRGNLVAPGVYFLRVGDAAPSPARKLVLVR